MARRSDGTGTVGAIAAAHAVAFDHQPVATGDDAPDGLTGLRIPGQGGLAQGLFDFKTPHRLIGQRRDGFVNVNRHGEKGLGVGRCALAMTGSRRRGAGSEKRALPSFRRMEKRNHHTRAISTETGPDCPARGKAFLLGRTTAATSGRRSSPGRRFCRPSVPAPDSRRLGHRSGRW